MNYDGSPSPEDFTATLPDGRQMVIGFEGIDGVLATTYSVVTGLYGIINATSVPNAYTHYNTTTLLNQHLASTNTQLNYVYNGVVYPYPSSGTLGAKLSWQVLYKLSYNPATKTLSRVS
jgi:hypothetical protein